MKWKINLEVIYIDPSPEQEWLRNEAIAYLARRVGEVMNAGQALQSENMIDLEVNHEL